MAPPLLEAVRGAAGRAGRLLVAQAVEGDLGAAADGARLAVAAGQRAWARRRWTAVDVDAFGRITCDLNPAHEAGEAGQPALVHGLLNASLIPALFAARLPGAVYLSQQLEFRSPVHVGDAVRAHVEVRLVKELRGRGTVVECDTAVLVERGGSGCGSRANEVVAVKGSARVLLPLERERPSPSRSHQLAK
jgi:3-hydroxybutyryl-CoA dehydratase